MECSVFETMIGPYVEGKTMSAEDTEKFLEHLEHCPECYDELETHYIVYQVSRQLDDAESADSLEVSDFKNMLENQIKESRNSIRRTNHWILIVAFSTLFLVSILIGFLIHLLSTVL